MKDHSFFERTKISRLFFLAAIPGAIGMLASVIYQFVDGIFVSMALGPTAFAAVNLAFPLVIAAYSVSDMLAVGSSVLISIQLGKKRDEDANRLFTTAILLIIAVTTTLGLFFGSAANWLISMMGATGELLAMASSYLRIYAVFLPFSSLFFALDNYLRISGKIKTSMFINVGSSLLIVLLESLFLFVFKLPLWSAALASCLSFVVGTVASLMPFLLKKLRLRFCRPRFDWREIWAMGRNGFPVFLTNIAGRITAIAFNSLLLTMGGEAAVNAYGVLMYVDGFILSILYGMCDSLQPAIGYNYGAGKMDRVKKFGLLCFLSSFAVCLVGFALSVSLPTQIAGLFLNSSTAEGIEMAGHALLIFSFAYLFRWISYAGSTYSSALERPGASLIISVSYNLVFPLVLIGCLYSLGLLGIWLNFPITSLAAAFVSAIVFYVLVKKLGLYEKPANLELTGGIYDEKAD